MAFSNTLREEFSNDTKIDLSPMIDCVFILLIFFIVTTVFVEEIGITANHPSISTPPTNTSDVEPMTLQLSSNGTVQYHNRSLHINEIPGLVRQVLTTQPDIPVVIRVENGVKHQLFAEVYGGVKSGGATKVSFK